MIFGAPIELNTQMAPLTISRGRRLKRANDFPGIGLAVPDIRRDLRYGQAHRPLRTADIAARRTASLSRTEP